MDMQMLWDEVKDSIIELACLLDLDPNDVAEAIWMDMPCGS